MPYGSGGNKSLQENLELKKYSLFFRKNITYIGFVDEIDRYFFYFVLMFHF